MSSAPEPPCSVSLPSPPSRRSGAAPPSRLSSPAPPISVSWPKPPISVSLPSSPLRTSSPEPPSIQSLPAPPPMSSGPVSPVMRSSPPRPRIRSAPPAPVILSGPSVPVSASAALEPLTVLATAVAAGEGGHERPRPGWRAGGGSCPGDRHPCLDNLIRPHDHESRADRRDRHGIRRPGHRGRLRRTGQRRLLHRHRRGQDRRPQAGRHADLGAGSRGARRAAIATACTSPPTSRMRWSTRACCSSPSARRPPIRVTPTCRPSTPSSTPCRRPTITRS